MTWDKDRFNNDWMCYVISWFLSTNKVSRTYWDYMAIGFLFGSVCIYEMVNLFMFLGN